METAPITMPAIKLEASRTALLALIAVNLIPLVGVLYWDWSVFEIVFLYWCENLIVGFITALKMLTAFPEPTNGTFRLNIPGKGNTQKIPIYGQLLIGTFTLVGKLFLLAFFIVHYGMFCMGHGIFIFSIFGDESFSSSDVWRLDELIAGPLLLAFWALLLSHLYSFLVNYLFRGEFRRSTARDQMTAPYKRIVVLHLTIIAGGGVSMVMGSPFWMLALLIGLKIVLDSRAHLKEHQPLGAKPPESNQHAAIISNLA
jgi:hypothetical protein